MFDIRQFERITYRNITNEILDFVVENILRMDNIIGILICEGDINSIDYAVYSAVFPDLYVIPVGGCSTVTRLTRRLMEKLSIFDFYVFGIIDRDALSKREIKLLYRNASVYTTKLPFIENIICAPETLIQVANYKNIDPDVLISKVQDELIKILWQKLKEALPINLGISKNEKIGFLSIGASTRRQQISKEVCQSNVLYSYRDKVITNIVASHIGLKTRKDYYNLIKSMLVDDTYRPLLVKVFTNFIPKLELYNLNDY